MRERPAIWLLVRGEELAAELLVEREDPPWFHGRVVPRDGFEASRAGVRLIKPDGHEVPQFMLHIDGRRVSWQCSDQGVSACSTDDLGALADPAFTTTELRLTAGVGL